MRGIYSVAIGVATQMTSAERLANTLDRVMRRPFCDALDKPVWLWLCCLHDVAVCIRVLDS
jgi:hypothetical protein